MAVAFEDTLKKDLSSKKTSSCYLLFGDDGFLKKSYADKIAALVCPEDDVFNLQKFEGDCDLQNVYDAVLQFPMMADKKCVTLCDYDFEHASKADFDKLCELLSLNMDTAVLIVRYDAVEFDYKKSAKAKKLIAAVQKGQGKAVALNHKRPAELVKMLTDGAAKRGCKMDSSVARFLIETVSEDIDILKNELNKLCSYVKNGDITKQTVDFVCTKTIEASVYNLLNDIIGCNIPNALKTLDELFFMHLEPIIILHTIFSGYVDMYRVSTAKKAGRSISDVAADFGYKGREFVLERAGNNLKKLDSKRISLSFDAILNADKSLKSFNCNERTVLEQLVVRLVYIILKGEAVD